MGIVYEAFDATRNLRVALKTIRAEAHSSISRFWNEFQALAELRHENLVRIYELVTEGDVTFYTMELVDGVDFRTWIAPASDNSASDFFDFARVREAFRQLAEALSYIHASGHLHRDLKPTNVLVTRSGKVKVVDFGLAARVDQQGLYENSAPGQAVGTLAYMAPEQAAGSDLIAAADWYSFGVMMYECLMARLPFTLNSIFELQEQKKRGKCRAFCRPREPLQPAGILHRCA
jgi:serine/threonine protein kinase